MRQGLRLPVALQRRRRRRGAAAPGQDARGRARGRLQRLRRGRAPSARRPTSSPATSTCRRSWSSRSTTASTRAPASGSARSTGEPRLARLVRRRSSRRSRRSSATSSTSRSRGNQLIERMYARADAGAVPVACSPTTASRNGRDYNDGGARYNNTYIQGVGIGSLTDSLAAIAHRRASRRSALAARRAGRAPSTPTSRATRRSASGCSTGRRSTATTTSAPTTSCAARSTRFFDAVDGRPNAEGGVYRHRDAAHDLPRLLRLGDRRHAGRPARRPAALRGHLARAGRRPPRPDRRHPVAPRRWTTSRTGGTLLNMKFTPVAARGRRRDRQAGAPRAQLLQDGRPPHPVQRGPGRDAARGAGAARRSTAT